MAAITVSNRLLISNMDSRDMPAKPLPCIILGARAANRASEPPTTTDR